VAAAVRDGTRLPSDCWLSVNVSADVVSAENGLAERVLAAGRPMVLEITEHEPVRDYERLSSAFERLGRQVMLAVDDAGTGYSSLRHILRLRPRYVKLDMEWVRAIETDPARQALVSGLGRFAATTGALLIAEAVETEAERACLLDLGVTLGQGYLFGRPAPVAIAA
jgi:EAL domain-containing protein (putative c-di-GMP-specific phosphodiesterase class I)